MKLLSFALAVALLLAGYTTAVAGESRQPRVTLTYNEVERSPVSRAGVINVVVQPIPPR